MGLSPHSPLVVSVTSSAVTMPKITSSASSDMSYILKTILFIDPGMVGTAVCVRFQQVGVSFFFMFTYTPPQQGLVGGTEHGLDSTKKGIIVQCRPNDEVLVAVSTSIESKASVKSVVCASNSYSQSSFKNWYQSSWTGTEGYRTLVLLLH